MRVDTTTFKWRRKQIKADKKEQIRINEIKNKERYDIKEYSINIHVKDLILLKDNTSKFKLYSLWLESFEMIGVLSNKNIVIQRERTISTVHNNVKKYFDNQKK